MSIQIEELAPQHQLVHITLGDADYRPKFDAAMKDLSKKVQIPGFRTGHVPPGMVRKMYGNSVLLDELYKLVNSEMDHYLKENNYELLGDALPVENTLDFNSNEPKEYTFSYEIGIQPPVDVEKDVRDAKTFTRYTIEATETEIAEEMERLRRKYGKREDVDIVEDNDVIYAHLEELDADGNVLPEGHQKDTYFNLQMVREDKRDLFLGASSGSAQNIDDVFSVFTGERDKVAQNVLLMEKMTPEEAETLNGRYSVRIDKVARLMPADLDEAFYAEASKEYGEVADQASLESKIKEVIERYNSSMTEVSLENDLYSFINDTTQVPLPEVFLRKWYEKTNEKEVQSEHPEKEFEDFIKRLKQSLVFRHVQKKHDLAVTNDEVIEEAVIAVRQSYGQLGDDFVNYILQSQLKEKQFVENMQDRAMQKKFFAAVKQYVQIEEKPITLEAFQKMTKQEEAYAE